MESVTYWILVGMGIMFLVAAGAFFGMILWVCHITARFHRQQTQKELPSDECPD